MTNKRFNIFLDDERVVEAVTWLDLPLKESQYYSIVRNGKHFKNKIDLLLDNNQLPSCLSFDHDLEDFQNIEKSQSRLDDIQELWGDLFDNLDKSQYTDKMQEVFEEKSLLDFYLNYGKENKGLFGFGKSNFYEITGKSCLDYFCDRLLDLLEKNKISVQSVENIQVFFHTQNNVGKKNMESYWLNFLTHIKKHYV